MLGQKYELVKDMPDKFIETSSKSATTLDQGDMNYPTSGYYIVSFKYGKKTLSYKRDAKIEI
jgi:hypothetical protein